MRVLLLIPRADGRRFYIIFAYFCQYFCLWASYLLRTPLFWSIHDKYEFLGIRTVEV